MNGLFNYLWEASLALFLLFAFYKIFLSRLSFFTWNRAFLLASLLFAMILPLLSFSISNSSVFIPEMLNYNLPEFQLSETEVQSSSIQLLQILVGIYFIGLLWKLGTLGIGLFITFKKIYLSRRIRKGGLCFVIHPEFQPSSFFHFVFLPAYDENDPAQQPIIHHESIHAEKWHSLDLILLQLAQAILWFHPVWGFYEANLREVHEYEADQKVTATYPKTAYAKLLLGLLITESNGHLLNNFNHFQTKKRIQMMMKSEKSRAIQKSLFLLALPLMAAMLMVFACETEKEESFPETMDIPAQIAAANEVFDVVEEAPQFKGGMEEWSRFLSSTLHYPDKAKEAGIEGTVFVVFVVQPDGRVTNPEILKGIGGGCDEEALRVIRQSPDWIPGKQRDREVAVRMRLPIRFKLS
ncbi:M56 family metallopeptidase [Cecembia sp.]|uniref:M56 family metallopeptidase n=1 Tax=Cecembia sp. TaxID=1898110 RepID=UPI0025BEBE27|nr:M56 family metallopeptidase [Cecembia sp.]